MASNDIPITALSKMKITDAENESEDEDSMGMEVLPRSTSRRVTALMALHDQRENVYEEYKVARCALEAEYRQKYDKIYKDRCEIVTGVRDVEISITEREEYENDEDESDDIVGIPDFWMQAILRHEALGDLVEENDLKALSHITDIKSIDRDDLLGFKLEFHFSPNEFFTDTVLTKTYLTYNILDQGEPLLQSVTGCPVHWKPGKNLCEKVVKMKQGKRGGRSAGKQKPRVVKTESFFKFFMDPLMLDTDDEEDEEDETQEKYELNYDVDYEVALIFRNHIVPKAVLWFTGEATNSDDEEEYEEETKPVSQIEKASEGVKENAETPECKQS